MLKRDVKCDTANALLLNSLIQNNFCLFVLFNEMLCHICSGSFSHQFRHHSSHTPWGFYLFLLAFSLILAFFCSFSVIISVFVFMCLGYLVVPCFTVKISFLIFPYLFRFDFPFLFPLLSTCLPHLRLIPTCVLFGSYPSVYMHAAMSSFVFIRSCCFHLLSQLPIFSSSLSSLSALGSIFWSILTVCWSLTLCNDHPVCMEFEYSAN